ncbi:coenzyme A transporter [Candidozyma auris]|uniref:Mitochondrial carrier protein n=3 Tax=Candidozyma auris TaxID=498019 RepID=A0A8F3AGL6_CANAR|nr:hypothetical protein QG37_08105 [[Candida] auris]QWW23220.1 hypothetical protein CA7LBN_002021 [[Candida] auris]
MHQSMDESHRMRRSAPQQNGTIPTKTGSPEHEPTDPTIRPTSSQKIIDKHSTEYVVRSGIAGGISGSAAKTLIAPMDRIKILFQTSNPEFLKYRGSFSGFFLAGRKIWTSDGLYGLFQGHSVTLLRIFPYAAIKFVAYEQIRSILIPNDSYETAVRRFMAGSLSGLTSVFFTYPLDLIRVRLAFETRELQHTVPGHDHQKFIAHHKGRLFSILKQVYKEHPPRRETDPGWLKFMREKTPKYLAPISNFYRGFGPTILGMIPYAGVSFYVHDSIHDLFRCKLLAPYMMSDPYPYVPSHKVVKMSKDKQNVSSRDSRKPLRAPAQLFAGGLAGMCSQTAAYPFEVIRRRMQVGGAVNSGKFLSFKQTVKLIFAESGFRGFFVGLSIGYMKVIPMSACSFFVYERCKVLLGI